MGFLVLIYNHFNILVRVEERPTRERAELAGKFYTKGGGWYRIIEASRENKDLYYSLINF